MVGLDESLTGSRDTFDRSRSMTSDSVTRWLHQSITKLWCNQHSRFAESRWQKLAHHFLQMMSDWTTQSRLLLRLHFGCPSGVVITSNWGASIITIKWMLRDSMFRKCVLDSKELNAQVTAYMSYFQFPSRNFSQTERKTLAPRMKEGIWAFLGLYFPCRD